MAADSSYTVRNEGLTKLHKDIDKQTNEWSSELKEIYTSVEMIVSSPFIEGQAADNLKDYLTYVHFNVISMISEILTDHSGTFTLYLDDYIGKVDSDVHAVLSQSEMLSIIKKLKTQKVEVEEIRGQTNRVIDSVQNLLSISKVSTTGVSNSIDNITTDIDKTVKAINNVENSHSKKDFSGTDDLIKKVNTMLKQYSGKKREYISSFDKKVFFQDATVIAAFASAENLVNNRSYDQKKLDKAYENVEKWKLKLEEEKHKRQRIVQFIEVGVAVIGAAVVIYFSAGTMSAVGLAMVEGAVGAVTAGVHYGGKCYINETRIDGLKLAGAMGTGFVISAATSYVSTGVSEYAAASLTTTKTGMRLATSESRFLRVGSKAVIGGISDVAAGIATRGMVYALENGFKDGYIKEEGLVKGMFDPFEIAKDAVTGSTVGGISEYRNIKAEERASGFNYEMNTDRENEILDEMKANGEFEIDGEDYGNVEITSHVEPNVRKKNLPTGETGCFNGELGNSEFTPNSKDALEEMAKHGRDTITYRNNEPQFHDFVDYHTDEWGDFVAEVQVENMGAKRTGSGGNYDQADTKLAQMLSERTGKQVSKADIVSYRQANKLTWHETQDGYTMQLVPTAIHSSVKHSGGVSVRKQEQALGDVGNDFGFIEE